MHLILLTPEIVDYVPVVGPRLVGYVGTTLNVACPHGLPTASYIGADGIAGDSTSGSGQILATPATNLVTENATDQGTGDAGGNIGVATSLGRHLFLLDPAALFLLPDHGA